jgi:hypothetical protein
MKLMIFQRRTLFTYGASFHIHDRVNRQSGPKRDEVTGEWRKLHNEELHNLYSSQNIIRQIKSRRMKWAGHVARMGDDRKMYKALACKSEGKKPLGRPRRRREDGIRIDLWEIGWGMWDGFNWLRIVTQGSLL